MTFVHPWQKDPSPSASREHSYSIYRRGRERVPCHWKCSIHQWTQMTSWYQDPEESMNNWKNQRGGIREWESLHSFWNYILNSRSGQSITCNPTYHLSLLKQGIAQLSMKLFLPLLQCCSLPSPKPFYLMQKAEKAIQMGYDGFLQKRPIHFNPFGESYHDDQVYRIFFMSEEMKLSERRWRQKYTKNKTTK